MLLKPIKVSPLQLYHYLAQKLNSQSFDFLSNWAMLWRTPCLLTVSLWKALMMSLYSCDFKCLIVSLLKIFCPMTAWPICTAVFSKSSMSQIFWTIPPERASSATKRHPMSTASVSTLGSLIFALKHVFYNNKMSSRTKCYQTWKLASLKIVLDWKLNLHSAPVKRPSR